MGMTRGMTDEQPAATHTHTPEQRVRSHHTMEAEGGRSRAGSRAITRTVLMGAAPQPLRQTAAGGRGNGMKTRTRSGLVGGPRNHRWHRVWPHATVTGSHSSSLHTGHSAGSRGARTGPVIANPRTRPHFTAMRGGKRLKSERTGKPQSITTGENHGTALAGRRDGGATRNGP